MAFQEQYLRSKERFLNDKLICEKNRKLFKEFFEYEEYKLKRMNGLDKLDEATYNTLGGYVQKLGNVNKWFKNKPWKELTKEDIKKVYDALEDGKIKNKMGQKIGDLKGYYGKIFKSKPFELAGKTEIVNEVMEFYKRNDKQEVRFIEQETFKKIASVVIKPEHKFLIWLSFDIGENINTLIQLKKGDFFRQINPNTKEAEYVVNLPKDKLKRTRQTRSEITNFKETVEFADIIFQNLKDDELPFKFGYRQAKKFLDRAVKITNAKCIPKGQPVTWKDLRSSMACYLLKSSWSLDEVNARLGHKPSSREIDKYINFLAIKRHDTKKKLYDNDVRRLADEIEERKKMESLQTGRIKNQQDEIEYLKIKMEEVLAGQKETVNGMHRLRADIKKSKQ